MGAVWKERGTEAAYFHGVDNGVLYLFAWPWWGHVVVLVWFFDSKRQRARAADGGRGSGWGDAADAGSNRRSDVPQRFGDLSDDCPICIEALQSPVLTSCGHLICADCFRQLWAHNGLQQVRCPSCRSHISLLHTLEGSKAQRRHLFLYDTTGFMAWLRDQLPTSSLICHYCCAERFIVSLQGGDVLPWQYASLPL